VGEKRGGAVHVGCDMRGGEGGGKLSAGHCVKGKGGARGGTIFSLRRKKKKRGGVSAEGERRKRKGGALGGDLVGVKCRKKGTIHTGEKKGGVFSLLKKKG